MSEPKFSELRDSIDELGSAVKAFKETNDERLDKMATTESVADIEEKLDKIDVAVSKAETKKNDIDVQFQAQRERIEELEALYTAGGGGFDATKKLHQEHRDVFYKMLASGGRHGDAEKLHQVQERVFASFPEQKRIDLTAGASGEFLLPEVIRAEVETMEQLLSPVRQLIPVVNITTNDFKAVVDILGTGSGWVGETDTRSITGTPQLRQRAPTMGELYARPEATQWAAMDLASVDQWLSRSVAEEFAKEEGLAVISGDGSNKPTGFLNTAPLVTADGASPLRDAEALQFVAAPSPDDITEHVISLIYTLNSAYRQGASFTMNSNILSQIRRAKDSNGQYLWQPSLIAGEPSTIVGFRFVVWEDMPTGPDSPLTTTPIAFGNWGRGYLLVQRTDVRVIRDEITNPGFIRWYFFRREGGIILNNDAIKVALR
jgi:HK97 family phage major capsid protein